MATTVIGLKTHIWNNNLKSIMLLSGFPILFILITWVVCMAIVGSDMASEMTTPDKWILIQQSSAPAMEMAKELAPAILAAVCIWFAIALFFHTRIIRKLTHSNPVQRSENPELYNMLENLCISRGLPMPHLEIIEDPALNAFASGISNKTYAITVTRGLLDTLNKEETEAVLGHELTHIMNKDVRLLIISIIFVGIISTLAEMTARSLFRSSMRSNKKNNGLLIMGVALVAVLVAYFFATLIRFAISRKREFMADAGAVELTKNPEAMISALEKISGHSKVENVDEEVEQMFFENEPKFAFMKKGIFSIFTTHPPIEKRIEILRNFT